MNPIQPKGNAQRQVKALGNRNAEEKQFLMETFLGLSYLICFKQFKTISEPKLLRPVRKRGRTGLLYLTLMIGGKFSWTTEKILRCSSDMWMLILDRRIGITAYGKLLTCPWEGNKKRKGSLFIGLLRSWKAAIINQNGPIINHRHFSLLWFTLLSSVTNFGVA